MFKAELLGGSEHLLFERDDRLFELVGRVLARVELGAARHVDGTVLMYADRETDSMKTAISETNRRREIQLAHNERHGITAASISKGVSDIAEFLQAESKTPKKGRRGPKFDASEHAPDELEKAIVTLEEEMLAAAEELRFEHAARLRDELRDLKRQMGGLEAAGLRPEPATD